MPGKLSKSCRKNEMGEDRISNLPDNVIDRILSCVPIIDSAKTSLLSRKWRYKWQTITSLVFNDQSLPLLCDEEGLMIRNLVSEINHILLFHSGLICKFDLSYQLEELPVENIDKWIIYISRHPMKEFTLSLASSTNYKMLSCFFSCQNLTHLELQNCSLHPPSTFKGFKDLQSLKLKNVYLKQDVFETLMSTFVLEKLSLDNLDGVDHLYINAPNLRSFDFEGPFDKLKLQNTYQLVEFTTFNSEEYLGKSVNLPELFAEIPHIERLTHPCSTFESFDLDDIPSELPDPFLNLHYMFMSIDFRSLKGSLGLLCLLRSVPNLQELVICCSPGAINELGHNVWLADEWNQPFTRLRHVRIINFGGIQVENDFVGFMLLTSHALMEMAVQFARTPCKGDRKKFEMAKRLCKLKRASPQVEIVIS